LWKHRTAKSRPTFARETDGPRTVAETLRNAGWIVFRLRFAAGTWIAHVINSKRSA
jgi:hypothetical protein